MPLIKVDTQGINSLGGILGTVRNKNEDCYSEVRIVKSNLDWQIQVREEIDDKLYSLQRRLKEQEDKLEAYIRVLQTAINDFEREDKNLSRKAGNLVYEMKNCDYSKTSNGIKKFIEGVEMEEINLLFSIASGASVPLLSLKILNMANNEVDSLEKRDVLDVDWENTALHWLEAFLKKQDKTGVSGGVLSYIKELEKIIEKINNGDMKGLSGAKDICGLGDKSIGLWTGLYEYLKDFYKETGITFSKENQLKVEGLDIISNLIGALGSVFGAADTISNTEGIGAAGITGNIIGIGDDFVDVAGSAIKYSNIGNTASNITTKEGSFSPLSLWMTTIKSILSTTSQGFLSYEKYIADGNWDLGDTAVTAIDASVSGLYSIVDSLISTVTFGFVSGKAFGIEAGDISEMLKNKSENIGDKAGKYIRNHKDLYQEYQSGNVLKKVAITFYAAVVA